MDVFHPTETCIICLQMPQLDLISLQSYSCIENLNSQQNANAKAKADTEETRIAFMLTDISGHDFDAATSGSSSGICEHCVKDLTMAYKFKKRCSTAFQQLTSILIPKPNKVEIEEAFKGETDDDFEQGFADNSFDDIEDGTNNIPIEMVEIQEMDVDNSGTTNKKFECEICKRVLSRKSHLIRHMTTHAEEKAHACIYCPKTFARADKLRSHIKTRHPENNLQSKKNAVICPEKPVVNTSIDDDLKVETNSAYSEGKVPGKQEIDKNNACSTCGMTFKRKPHLIRHMTTHTDERNFECSIEGCPRKFRRIDHLKNHMNTHSPFKTHECSYCPKTFTRADILRSHIKARHPENNLQNKESAVICPEEPIMDISQNEFKEEPNNIYADALETQGNGADNKAKQMNKFECEMCGRFFMRKSHLIRHMTIHTDSRNFECIQCHQKFRRRDHLQNHMNIHSKLKTKKCSLCDYSTARLDNLRNHIRARHTEKEPQNDAFICCKCDRSFISLIKLKAHERYHNTTLICKYGCDIQFSSIVERNKHVSQMHPNELKIHLCSECGMTFSRHDYLLTHIRRHRGETRYHCKFCQKGFFRSTDVRVHEKYHTNVRPHSCSLCNKKFSRPYNLTIHMRVHTGEKPFVCTHSNCTQAFSQSNDLKVHLRRHTGERFKCDVDNCNDSFIQMYLLTRHKRDVHSIDVPSHIKRLTKFIPLEFTKESSQSVDNFMEMPASFPTTTNYQAPPMGE